MRSEAIGGRPIITATRRRKPRSRSTTSAPSIRTVPLGPYEVLILDEPEQRLDPEHVESVIRVLRARRDGGATIVVATHSQLIADELADGTLQLDAA